VYAFVKKALQSSHTHVFICEEEAHSHPCIVFLCVSVCVFFSWVRTDQSLSVSACESPRHDRSSNNPYWMVRSIFCCVSPLSLIHEEEKKPGFFFLIVLFVVVANYLYLQIPMMTGILCGVLL
jgi:hypothetical protein